MKTNTFIILATAFALSACGNTFDRSMQGAGEDIQGWGKSLETSFDPTLPENQEVETEVVEPAQ